MNFAVTLSGHRCHRARITMPARGIWQARVELDDEILVAGPTTVSIGDNLVLVGTVVRGQPFAGTSRYLVRGGFGGWGDVVQARGYRSDAGVKASTVLADAARDAGETWAAPLPTTTIGLAFARRQAPAVHVVTQLLGGAWYVGDDGHTVPVVRPPSPFVGEVLDVDHDARAADLASDVPESVRPGCAIDPIGIATSVEIETGPEGIHIRAWGQT